MKHKILKFTALYFLIASTIFVACEDTNMETNDFIRIYLTDSEEYNVLAMNIFENSGFSYDIFGISTQQEALTKYEGKGNLYYLIVDKKGNYTNHQIISLSDNGFPSNILKIADNQYLTVWNNTKDSTQEFKLISTSSSLLFETKPLNLKQIYQTNYVLSFCKTLSNNGYILLVLSGDDKNLTSNVKKTRLVEVDLNFAIRRNLGEYEFSTESFGIIGGLTQEFLKRMDNFVYVRQDTVNKRYYFNAPIDNKMTLMHIGDNVPIFQDKDYWAAALQEIRPDTASVILNTPMLFDKKSYFIRNLPLYPHRRSKDDFAEIQTIENIDISQRIYTGKVGEKNIILATANSGQGIRYWVTNGRVENALLFGKIHPYSVAGFIAADNNQMLVILGTTKLENGQQRIFLLKTENE